MQDVWRLFAAIEIPPEVRERIAAVTEHLRASGWRAKWVNPEGSHLTLKFFGYVPVDTIPALRDALRPAVAPATSFVIETAGAGAFPTPRRPRVLWLGVGGDVARLTALQQAVERASAAQGYPPEERAFHPHLTLARVRPEDLPSLAGLERRLRELAALPPLPIPVERVTLFRSELRRTGAIYTVVDEFALDGGAA
ncbi:MAG: RNA 2',3'-cyclic phosphodiesterase [Sphaerobacter sp.]|nr:RNA 2',3'-cyclic phosphodiesterase [Sphaerobacter sp.]